MTTGVASAAARPGPNGFKWYGTDSSPAEVSAGWVCVKRDGTAAPFDASKIAGAVSRCLGRVGLAEGEAAKVAARVCRGVVAAISGQGVEKLGVEEVQRFVVAQLWAEGLFDAAEHYQNYREAHRRQRLAKPISPEFQALCDEMKEHFPTDLQAYQFLSKFARWSDENKRRETWAETCHERVMPWFKKSLRTAGHDLDDAEWTWLGNMMHSLKSSPAMRVVQMAGPSLDRCHMGVYNCLGAETRFVTRDGVKSFGDFKDGDTTTVLTHTGAWKPAVVRSYGKQKLHNHVIRRGATRVEVRATADHRWVLKDGSVSAGINVGDRLHKAPYPAAGWSYDAAEPFEKLAWAYGYVFGDGTRIKKDGEYRYSMVRLCGADAGRFAERFEELGFASSRPLSYGGDIVVYTGAYLKTTPPVDQDIAYIRAFVRGYLDADGQKQACKTAANEFCSVQVTGKANIAFVREVLPMAGYYITREEPVSDVTNLGERSDETIRFGLLNNSGEAPNSFYSLTEKTPCEGEPETVWCLEVEDDHSFVLPEGIVTGNCAALPMEDLRNFAELLYILMQGSGCGFSVEAEYVDKLPKVQKRNAEPVVTVVVSDTTEGWCDALLECLEIFFSGGDAWLDTSAVRPAGSRLMTKGGRASGPGPLIELIAFIRNVVTARRGKFLEDTDVHQICCFVGRIVQVGGVRRAATISLSDLSSSGMRDIKHGAWWKGNGYWIDGKYLSMANNCLPVGTPVHTTRGPIPIEEVRPGDVIVTAAGRAPVLARADSGVKATVLLSHAFGELECTPEHRVAVFDTLDSWIFKPASEVRPGDALVFDCVGCEGEETGLPAIDEFAYPIDVLDRSGIDTTYMSGPHRPVAALRQAGLVAGSSKALPLIVKSVSASDRFVQTYDLEVDRIHQFTAGGLVVHNSAVYEEKPTAELFLDEWNGLVKSKSGERGIFNRAAAECHKPARRKSAKWFVNPCFHPDTRIATASGLMRIVDLYGTGPNRVVVDRRPLAGDEIQDGFGVGVRTATQVELTQRQADVYTLTTEHGHKVVCTANHEFPTADGRKQLHELVAGDTLLLQSAEGEFGTWGTYDEGFLLGLIAGDGCTHVDPKGRVVAYVDLWEGKLELKPIAERAIAAAVAGMPTGRGCSYPPLTWNSQVATVEKIRMGGRRLATWLKIRAGLENVSDIKVSVPECIWMGSRDAVRGYIAALFATDGMVNVSGNVTKQTVSLRLNQSNKKLLEEVQALLQNFGITSRLYSRRAAGDRMMPDGRGGMKNYFCTENFDIVVSRPNCVTFVERIGLPGRKGIKLAKALAERGEDCRKPERYISKVKSIEHAGVSDVYCLNQPETHTVIANGVVSAQCAEIIFRPYGLCVSHNTPLIARDGLVRIGEAENKEVEVWNGKRWSRVTVVKTGTDRQLVRVTMSDGSYLDCTPEHRFSVNTPDSRFKRGADVWSEVKAKDLKPRMATETFAIRHEDGETVPDAYTLGVLVGDGCVEQGYAMVDLYGPKMSLPVAGRRGREILKPGYNVPCVCVNTGKELVPQMRAARSDDEEFWKRMFQADRESSLAFLAGWFDTDGSETGTGGVRLYVSGRYKADMVQLLLTRCGIRSSVNLVNRAGTETNFGRRNADLWYVQVTDCGDIPCHRLDVSGGHEATMKGKYQTVVSVEYLPGLHDTFCFDEPEEHKGVFNNTLTFQCNLSIAVARPDDTEDTLREKVMAATYFGVMQSMQTNFKYVRPEWAANCHEERLIGVDITGHADCPLLRYNAPGRGPLLARLKELVAQTAQSLSARFGINYSAANTTVKPSGDSAVFFNCGSGISALFAAHQIRWVREGKDSPIAKFLVDAGVPHAPAPEAPDRLLVFGFPKKAPKGATLRNDLTAVQQCENWLEWKKEWAEHSVSATIYVDEHEWVEVGAWVYSHFDQITGLSFLPKDNGTYTYAPNEEITEAQYDKMVEEFPDLNWAKVSHYEYEDMTESAQTFACVAGGCTL